MPLHPAIRGPHDPGFTERELCVALWLAEGKTNREIGLILGSSVRTIEKHVEHLFAKLGVENRTAAAIALRSLIERGAAAKRGMAPAALRRLRRSTY